MMGLGVGVVQPVSSQYARVNGWSWPPNALQIVAWCVVLYLLLVFYGAIAFAFIEPVSWAMAGLVALLFILHIVVHLAAVCSNPADPNVIKKIANNPEQAEFDRSQHRHVIENLYCYICMTHVSEKSKHCSQCNKCVSGFDHHCKWLNNCVGANNYRLFIATLLTAIVGIVLIFSLCLTCFIAYFTDVDQGSILKAYWEALRNSNSTGLTDEVQATGTTDAVFRLYGAPVPFYAWLIMIGVTAVLSAAAASLLIHLFGFHIYLMYEGISTYDYIVRSRMRAEQAAREREQDQEQDHKYSKSNKNRVLPEMSEYELNDSGKPTSRYDNDSDDGGGSGRRRRSSRSQDYEPATPPDELEEQLTPYTAKLQKQAVLRSAPPVPPGLHASEVTKEHQSPAHRKKRRRKHRHGNRDAKHGAGVSVDRTHHQDGAGEAELAGRQASAGSQRTVGGMSEVEVTFSDQARHKKEELANSADHRFDSSDDDETLQKKKQSVQASGGAYRIEVSTTPTPSSHSNGHSPQGSASNRLKLPPLVAPAALTSANSVAQNNKAPRSHQLLIDPTLLDSNEFDVAAATAAAGEENNQFLTSSHSLNSDSDHEAIRTWRSNNGDRKVGASPPQLGWGESVGGQANRAPPVHVEIERLQLPLSSGDERGLLEGPGLYSPHGYSVNTHSQRPAPVPALPVQPAAPIAQYNSDSAESLTEVPVARGPRTTGASPKRTSYYDRGDYNYSSNNAALHYENERDDGQYDRGDHALPPHSPSKGAAARGSRSRSRGHHNEGYVAERGDSSGSRGRERHRDVPPLDLSSFNEDSDEEQQPRVGFSKKYHKKQPQDSKI